MSRNSDKIIEKSFIELKPSLNNLWVYQIRKNIYTALEKNLKHFKGEVLDLGCGIMPYKNTILRSPGVSKYIGMDLENSTYYADIKPDMVWDGITIPLEDNSIDSVLATEVLEHCYEPELLLKEIYRVLKPGGIFFCTVPFIWHLHEIPFDEYRYTPFSLEKKLRSANFNQIHVLAIGGWDSALSQMLGLWVTYRPMNRINKSFLLRLVKFIIKRLDRSDRIPSSYNDNSQSMISGLSALAFKK